MFIEPKFSQLVKTILVERKTLIININKYIFCN